MILPGHCRGDLTPVLEKAWELRSSSAPKIFATCLAISARPTAQSQGYGAYDIEILAEINHAPRLPRRAAHRPGRAVRSRTEPT